MGTHKIDDITVVSALLCDCNIKLVDVVAEDHINKKASSAHCHWVLETSLKDDEFNKIVDFLKKTKVALKENFSYICEYCGILWIENGSCGRSCSANKNSFYKFDDSKRIVIDGLRAARQTLAEKRGEGNLYGKKENS